MSSLKIYVHPLSQPARAVMLFCRANSIQHEEKIVDLVKGAQHNEEYAKTINPLKKVPVIEHDGFFLKESVAILRYLARTFPVPDNWFPKDSVSQAKVDEYLEWQHLNVRTFGTLYFAEKYIVPRTTKQPPNEKRAANFLKHYIAVLNQVETIWLKDRPFLAGQDISIADLLAAAEMEQTVLGGYDVKENHPKLQEYLERVRGGLQPHYDDVHSMLNKIASKMKATQ
ncbi:Glutathione S-transferase theta-2 [Orchesella cincta]|uniref:Glutathione S-transferase theta-2 n=1 Tax=Orchesella cincta TaxID=48709 RepID=A0A1D2NE83_ORCCI|nr:Glutathione S-transferase theta-2 [Orchesella cincta]